MNPINSTATLTATIAQANGNQPATNPAKAEREAQARNTAETFEAMFLSTMLSSMNLGIDPDSVMGGGEGEAAYQSLVAEQYGKSMTEMGGIGIADAIYKEILRAQEAG
ncbi:MAG: rod-binding protein [Minwuia sp.]|nr:rod-binding protein [Minwuia sp.]